MTENSQKQVDAMYQTTGKIALESVGLAPAAEALTRPESFNPVQKAVEGVVQFLLPSTYKVFSESIKSKSPTHLSLKTVAAAGVTDLIGLYASAYMDVTGGPNFLVGKTIVNTLTNFSTNVIAPAIHRRLK